MSAYEQMKRQLAVTCDLLEQMAPGAATVEDGSSLVDELTAEEFDSATINEAHRLLVTATAAIDATEAAYLSAEPLRASLEQL